MRRTFGSVCSGIEAASLAFGPLGWSAAWFSEIEPFPCAVLAHHYPDVPNLGDMTALPDRVRAGEVEAPDMLCGGTPCQAFSVAGNRESLADARGNLTLTFCELADAIDDVRSARGGHPCVVFWENVPGVLSTKDNAFGCFLGELVGAGAALVPGRDQRWTDAGVVAGPRRVAAWRVLDAQHFGLAQRRRRVFVVASARAGFDPSAVLLERQGLPGHPAARSGAREDSPARSVCRADDGGIVAKPLLAGGHGTNPLDENLIAFDPTQITSAANRSNPQPGDPCHTLAKGQHAPAIAFNARQDQDTWVERTGPLDTDGSTQAVAFDTYNQTQGTCAHPVRAGAGAEGIPATLTGTAVRRLTPRECERLQGFPDDYTLIPWRGKPAEECPDGPRYKAIGNSWAVDCVEWIAARLTAHLREAA
jgi:DNA (cytosine-5)-methyltransferase 1